MAFFDKEGDKRMEKQNGPAWKAIAGYIERAKDDLPIRSWDIMDWGCHSGGLLKTLDEEIGAYIQTFAGVEPDREACDRAQERFPRSLFRHRFIEVPDHSVDVMVSHEVLYLIPNLDWFFQELKRVLRPDGAAFVALGSHSENKAWLYRLTAVDAARNGVSYVHQPMDILKKCLEAGFHPPEVNQLWPAGYPDVLRYTPPALDWPDWESVGEMLEFRRQKLIFQFWPRA